MNDSREPGAAPTAGGAALSATTKPRLFLSYSRRDALLAAMWVEAVNARGHEIFQDTSGIPYGAAWRDWIRQEMARADAVLFLVSPLWLASPNCREELDIAVEDRKRLLPVAVDIAADLLPTALAGLNSIRMERGDPQSPLGPLVDAVSWAASADLDWLQRHRRLLQEARDWQQDARAPGRLLEHEALAAIDHALQRRDNPDPALSTVQIEFIAASRANIERRRRNRLLAVVVGAALVTVAGVFALLQRQERIEQSAQADARRLLQVSRQAFMPQHHPLAAMRIALAARELRPLPEVDELLREALAVMPAPNSSLTLPSTASAASQPGENWSPRALVLPHGKGPGLVVMEDGRRNLRAFDLPGRLDAIANERSHTLTPGWVGESAPYGGRLVYQPEPDLEPSAPGRGDQALVLAANTITPEARFSLPGRGKLRAALDPEGRFLALARDAAVELWQVSPMQRLGRWEAPKTLLPFPWGDFNRLAVHPGGRAVVFNPSTARVGYAPLWALDVISGTMQIITVFPESALSVAFSRDGSTLAAGDRYGSLRLFGTRADVGRWYERRRISLIADGIGITSLALAEDGSQVAAYVRNVEVFDTATGARTGLIEGGGPMLFAERDSLLWVGDSDQGRSRGRHGPVVSWQLTTAGEYRRTRLARQLNGSELGSFDYLPGTHDIVATLARPGYALRANPADGNLLQGWPLRDTTGSLHHSTATPGPSATVLFVGEGGAIRVGSTGATPLPATAGMPKWPRFALAPSGSHAIAHKTEADQSFKRFSTTILGIDLSSGRVLSTHKSEGAQTGLRLSEPLSGSGWGLIEATAGTDSDCPDLLLVPLTELATPVARLPCPTGEARSRLIGSFDRSGTRLALVSDKHIELRKVPGLQLITRLGRLHDAIDTLARAITWSHDGRQLAILEGSQRVTVYDTALGTVLARMVVRSDSVSSLQALRFSDDGQWLAANLGRVDGTAALYVWRWRDSDMLEQVCERLVGAPANASVASALPMLLGLTEPRACASRADRTSTS